MSTAVAEAYVQIIPEAKTGAFKNGIAKTMESEAEEAGSEAGTKAGNGLMSTLKKVIIAAGIGTVIKDALTAGADLEQSIGGIETLFGDSATKMKQAAAEAYATAGLSANEYMQQTTSFAATLLQSLDNDTEAAADYANKAVIQMSDNANKMGTSIESIQNAYQGFAKGNYTMLDNLKLGYGGTATEMLRLVKDAGVVDASVKSINDVSFDQIIEGIGIIQDRMGITGTTAAEAADTFSGSMAAMQASWQNVLAALSTGDGMSDALSGLISSVTTFVEGNAIPMIVNVLSDIFPAITLALQRLLPSMVTAITTMLPGLIQTLATSIASFIPLLMTVVTNAIIQIAQMIPTVLPTLMQSVATLVTGIAEQLPTVITSITEAIPTLIEGIIDAFTENYQTLMDAAITLFGALVEAIPQVITLIIDAIPQILDSITAFFTENLPTIVETGISLFTSLVSALPTIISTIVAALPRLITGIITFIVGNVSMIINAGIQLFTALITAMPQIIATIIASLPQIFTAIVNGIIAAVPQIIAAGEQLFNGLKEGIMNVIPKLIASVKEAAGKLIQAAKDVLGIHSPSRVFRDQIGENMMLGLAEGIEENVKPVTQAIDGVLDETTNAFDADLNVSSNLAGSTQLLADSSTNGMLSNIYSALEKIENMGIYLDSGELVGGIVTDVDKALNYRANRTARGAY